MQYNRIKKIATITAMLLALFMIPVYADSTQPGSADDPLVTKSYVDQAIAQKLGGGVPNSTGSTDGSALTEAQVREIIRNELALAATPSPTPTITPVPTPNPSTIPVNTPAGPTESPTRSQLEVVVLQAGQTLMAGAGTEFIVRTGKTIAVSNDENGIPDVTGGKDIPAGTAVELNHLLVFPREGRGIKPDSKEKGEIYVMVRGAYLLVNQ